MFTDVPAPGEVTPGWLTAVLRQSGLLPEGEVVEVKRETTGAFNSHTNRLVLRYSPGISPEVPTRFVLKQNTSEAWSHGAGQLEVKFYRLVAALPDHPPVIIPCYGAAYDEQTGNSYVLLRDLTETHRPPITRDQQINFVEGVPPVEYMEAVVTTLAELQAYWWDHPLIKTAPFDVGYWSRDAERFGLYLKRRQKSWQGLMANEASWFPAELRDFYEKLFDRLPLFWEKFIAPRFRESKNLTLMHGDAYFCNFLCPRIPGSGPTYLLDWQSPGFDLAGYDLVNMLAAFWTPEQRHEQQREEKLLRLYHKVLQERGVTNFTWDELLTDYRLGLIFWVLMPVQDGFDGSGKAYWWPKMECLVAAFREWECARLLGF
jgi:hypothetical protein